MSGHQHGDLLASHTIALEPTFQSPGAAPSPALLPPAPQKTPATAARGPRVERETDETPLTTTDHLIAVASAQAKQLRKLTAKVPTNALVRLATTATATTLKVVRKHWAVLLIAYQFARPWIGPVVRHFLDALVTHLKVIVTRIITNSTMWSCDQLASLVTKVYEQAHQLKAVMHAGARSHARTQPDNDQQIAAPMLDHHTLDSPVEDTTLREVAGSSESTDDEFQAAIDTVGSTVLMMAGGKRTAADVGDGGTRALSTQHDATTTEQTTDEEHANKEFLLARCLATLRVHSDQLESAFQDTAVQEASRALVMALVHSGERRHCDIRASAGAAMIIALIHRLWPENFDSIAIWRASISTLGKESVQQRSTRRNSSAHLRA